MSGSGSHPEEWRRDAVADHEDIREAIGETKLQPIGSALWWRSARAGHQWLAFIAARRLENAEQHAVIS